MNGVVAGAECEIGPFARLAAGRGPRRHVKVGNFVEIKNSHGRGAGSKINHLTLHRRRDGRRGRERRCGHDHLQLRWREQAPYVDRRQRVHRLRRDARRAGRGRHGRDDRRRVDDHEGRARRRAHARALEAGYDLRAGSARRKNRSSARRPRSAKARINTLCAASSVRSQSATSSPCSSRGLKRLEYRGYDSAGLAVVQQDRRARPAPHGGQGGAARGQAVGAAARGAARRRAHALGDARRRHGSERAPACVGRSRRGHPQRHHRELRAAQGRARSPRATSSRRRRTPRSRRTSFTTI